MPEPPMILPQENLLEIESSIVTTEGMGARIRQILGEYHGGDHDIAWEVEASVEALEVFTSRWTIEILATLYIAGERRFNELRKLLAGISSRTLSDKLRACTENGLLDRVVRFEPLQSVGTALAVGCDGAGGGDAEADAAAARERAGLVWIN